MNTDEENYDWNAARERMILDPTIINLNTGSFEPNLNTLRVPQVKFVFSCKERPGERRRSVAAL